MAAQQDGFFAVLAEQRDRVAGFFEEDAGFDDAVVGDGDVARVVLVDGAVWVEDFAEQAVVRFVLAGGDVGADLVADVFELVAGRAVLLEDRLAALGVAVFQGRLIAG